MAFDGIVTKQIVSELKKVLIDGKINKVFEPNKNEIILGIYSSGKNYALDISISSNNYRIHLTTNSKPNPLNAPGFCMLLRKHLIGSKIKDIYTNSLERIVYINLEGYNELNDKVNKTLVVELMGKHSNIILLNEKNIIIDSLRHLDSSLNSTRDILPAHEYINPPNDKKDLCTTDFKEFNVSEKISAFITNNYNGISRSFILEILRKFNITDENYTKEDLKTIYNYIKEIINSIGTNKISIDKAESEDYVLCLEDNDNILKVNYFLDDFYSKKEDDEIISNYRNNLSKLILSLLKKVTKKVQNINSKLKECEDIDKYKIYGELITANLYKIKEAQNLSSITLENYYDNNKEITIPLDKTISISSNAQKFFKKYHKLQNTLSIVSIQKKEANQELEYLESIIFELENATTLYELEDIDNEISENVLFKNKKESSIKKNKINKRKVHDEYEPLTYNIDGFNLYVGKNNKQNDYITTKLGKNDDLWFHVKDVRGSHCLLKCNGETIENNTIVACAQIAAYYSRARQSSNVAVDYCPIRNVKKPSGSKPGMVIYKNYNTINVNPKSIK